MPREKLPPRHAIIVRFERPLWEKLKEFVKTTRRSYNTVLTDAITAHLSQGPNEKEKP